MSKVENVSHPGNSFIAEQFRPDQFDEQIKALKSVKESHNFYEKNPSTLAFTWGEFWNTLLSGEIKVPIPNITRAEVKDSEAQGDMLFYIPENLSIKNLTSVLPKHVNYSPLPLFEIADLEQLPQAEGRAGWRKAESSLVSPRRFLNSDPDKSAQGVLNSTVEDLKNKGRDVLSVTEYLTLSYFSKVTRGHYIDESSMTYLGEANVNDRRVNINAFFFAGSGRANFFYQTHIPTELGVRSSSSV